VHLCLLSGGGLLGGGLGGLWLGGSKRFSDRSVSLDVRQTGRRDGVVTISVGVLGIVRARVQRRPIATAAGGSSITDASRHVLLCGANNDRDHCNYRCSDAFEDVARLTFLAAGFLALVAVDEATFLAAGFLAAVCDENSNQRRDAREEGISIRVISHINLSQYRPVTR